MKVILIVSILFLSACASIRMSTPELTDQMFQKLTVDIENNDLKQAKETLKTAIQYDNGRGSFRYFHEGDIGIYELRDVDKKSKELIRYMVLAKNCSKEYQVNKINSCLSRGTYKITTGNYSLNGRDREDLVEDVKDSICGLKSREPIGYAQHRLPHVFVFRSESGRNWRVTKKLRGGPLCKNRKARR